MSNEAIKTLKMIDSLLGQMLAKLDRYLPPALDSSHGNRGR
jgi:hypothetical protein